MSDKTTKRTCISRLARPASWRWKADTELLESRVPLVLSQIPQVGYLTDTPVLDEMRFDVIGVAADGALLRSGQEVADEAEPQRNRGNCNTGPVSYGSDSSIAKETLLLALGEG